MESPTVNHVALMAEKVAAYGAQIAAVFHNHALSAERIPRGFEGSVNILDATVTTLKQALSLLKEEAAGSRQKLFNDEAIRYVQLLTSECATSLAKIEPTLIAACLSAKDAREKRKAYKKAVAKNGEPKIDPFKLALDEKAFLETVEATKWSRIYYDIQDCMTRLYDLQLHLLLVFQVVKVGALSRDLSSGKVDIKSIVAYHDRITRTADLIGIKLPTGRSINSRPKYDSSSDSDSIISRNSDSDNTSVAQRKRNRQPRRSSSPIPNSRGGLPPPPPANVRAATLPTAPPAPGSAADTLPSGDLNVNPPSYSESHKPVTSDAATSSVTPAISSGLPNTLLESAPVRASDEKKSVPSPLQAEKEPEKEPAEQTKTPLILEPRLFKGNTNSFGFKFRALFRSKQSLAEEMKKALGESESQLLAFVLRGYEMRQVPHSTFHSLETTHMRTILAQLNDDSWYKTFTSLSSTENQALQQVIRPLSLDPSIQREIVVLKVIEQNRFGSWMVLLKELIHNPAVKTLAGNRVLLAIVREKMMNGKPVGNILTEPGHTPPPPSNLKPKHPVLRPPPGLPIPTRSITRTSDLRFPPPPSAPPGWHVSYPPGFPIPRFPNVDLVKLSTSNSDLPVINDPSRYDGKPDDFAADRALRVFTEYTLRQVDYPGLSLPKSWSRVSITQESNDRDHLLDRIHDFKRTGGNVIEIKLRLSENQSSQLSRLLDELKNHERDGRFDWSWAAISLYTHSGIITNQDLMASDQEVPFNWAPTATVIHLIAERTLRPQYIPIDVYKAFMNPPPHPKPVGPPYGPPGPPGPPPNGPVIVYPTKVQKNRRYVSSSGSGSGSGSDSDGSVGGMRRRLRRDKARRVRRARNKASRLDGSDDSGSGSDSDEEDDVIEIKLGLKKGGDVVKAFLDLWTPQADGKGKGKMEA